MGGKKTFREPEVGAEGSGWNFLTCLKDMSNFPLLLLVTIIVSQLLSPTVIQIEGILQSSVP